MSAATIDEDRRREMRDLIRQRLREVRDEVHQALLQADRERYADLAEQVHDTGEEAVADLLSDLDLALVDHYLEEARELTDALERIRENSYGLCEDCGEAIALRRLEASPAARRCVDCQRRYESSHAGGVHPSL